MTAPACTCDTWGYCVACGPDRQAGRALPGPTIALTVAICCGACDFQTPAYPIRNLAGGTLADEIERHLQDAHQYQP